MSNHEIHNLSQEHMYKGLDELLNNKNINLCGRFLGIDFGQARVGLALSNSLGTVATPLGVEPKDKKIFIYIKQLVKQYAFVAIVIGVPIKFDGTLGGIYREAMVDFIKTLQTYVSVPIIRWPERLTSKQSTQVVNMSLLGSRVDRAQKERVNKIKIDAMAACLLLQFFLDYVKVKKSIKKDKISDE